MNCSTILRPSGTLIFVAVLLGQQLRAAPPVMPSGGAFTAGAGAIMASSNALTINQSSSRGIVNWNSFSIGKGGLVRFNNGSGATLNRVTGGNMSSILGTLISSGSVYLINPQGILVGPGAHVNTGGDFVASTLNVTNNDFLNGSSLVFTGDSHAVVANLGSIFSTNGSIFLIAHDVRNSGRLKAANASVGLAAGSEVLLKDSTSDGRVFVRGPGGDITNTGRISAAQAELKSKGGNIYALAGNDGGQISATGTAKIKGQVWLVADDGKTTVTGTVSAIGLNGKGGSVETSGDQLDISHAAVKTGQGGNWLLDPFDVLIDSAAATTIQNSLATTNVTVQTSATTASGSGIQTSGSGDINVGSGISWASANSLTLSAYRNINVNTGATISNSGSGNLTLYADNAATGTGTLAFAGSGNVQFTGSGNVSVYYHPVTFPTVTSYTAQITKGTGTLTAYITVDNIGNLQNSTNPSANYALNADINASSVANFVPITNLSSGFIFDGQLHTISNLTVNSSGQGGLFASNSGTIRNVVLTGESISGHSYSGGLVGRNSGVISSSMTSGGVLSTGSFPYVGGLTGFSGGTVSNSSSSANVSGSSTGSPTWVLVGGLVGLATGPVTDSYANGAVSISGTGNSKIGAGGLVGTQSGGTISNSYSTGAVTSTATAYNSQILGGMEGFVPSSGATISQQNSYWDTQSSGLSSSQSGTGLTTAQLQASTLPTGFRLANWTTVPSHYPYLNWQGTNVSGIVYNGASPVSGATVSNLVGGSAVASPVTTNSNGSYSFFAPTGTIPAGAGVLAYLTSGGVGNTFTDGNYGSTDIHTGTLRLLATNATTYSGMLTSLAPVLGSNTGSNFLFTNAGFKPSVNLELISAGNMSVDLGIAAPGTLLINSGGNLTIGNVTLSAAGSGTPLTLVSGGNFTSGLNSLATVSGGGRWLIYSQNPANDSIAGAFANDSFKQYAEAYTPFTGMAPIAQPTGSGLLYTLAPSVSAALTGNLNKVYDATATETLGAGNFLVSGAVAGDNVVLNLPISGSFVNKNAATGKTLTASGISLASGTAANGAPVYGYGLSSTTATGTADITAAQLSETFTANNKVYDGTTTATAVLGSSFSGLINGDSVQAGGAPVYNFSTRNAGTGKTVSESGLTLTGTDASNYSLAAVTQSGTAVITPAMLTQTINADQKAYDGTTAIGGFLYLGLGGIKTADNVIVDLSNAHFNFLDPNVAENKPAVETGVALAGNDSANYQLAVTMLPNRISPAYLQLSGSVANKIYDGTTAATGQLSIASGIVGSENVTLVSPTFAFSNKNVGNGKNVVYGASLGGPAASNYAINTEFSLSANITSAPLFYTAASANRIYGSLNPAFTGAINGLVNGETLASASTGTAAYNSLAAGSSNVGAYAVNGSGLTLNNSNYQLFQAPGNTLALTINPATLTYTAAAASRSYGTVDPSFSGAVSGFQNNETQASATTGTLTLASVASPSANIGNYAINGSGLAAQNYVFQQAPGNAIALTVNPAVLTGAVAANNKTYDSTASATGSVNLAGVYGNDSVSATGATLAFDNKNAGTGKTVTGSGASLTGSGAGNYTLGTLANGTADITPAPLAAAVSANNKTYDATTSATGIISLAGVFAGDNVSATGATLAFDNKNAGTAKTVSQSGLTLAGADAGNYAVAVVQNGTAAITAASLTAAITANNKTYDSTANATGTINLTGVLASDNVSATGATLAFDNKNAGTAKTVSESGLTLAGTDAGNYTAVVQNGAAAITPAALSQSFTANNKVYDATTTATAALGSLSGVIAGDSVSTSGTAAYNFTDKNAGTSKPVNATGLSLTGTDARNYTLTLAQAGTANITPSELLYIANSNSRGYGAGNPALSGSVTGLLGDDTLASMTTGTTVFTSASTSASNAGMYPIVGSGLSLTTGNYTLAQSAGNGNAFSINPVAITIGSFSRTSTQANPNFTVSSAGVSSFYLQSLLSGLTLVTDAPASNAPGIYHITAVLSAALGSDFLVQPGTLTITSAATTPEAPAALLPASLQTQTVPPAAPLAPIAAGSGDTLLPANSNGAFQIAILPSPAWSAPTASGPVTGDNLSSASFTEASPDGQTAKHKSTYAAGARP